MTVEFIEGPPPETWGRGGGGKWVAVLQPLIDRPGDWAIIYRDDSPGKAHSLASNLRGRRVKCPEGNWEFVVRTVDGAGRVYARYLGEAS